MNYPTWTFRTFADEYVAVNPDFGLQCIGTGKTPEAARLDLDEVRALVIEHLKENNLPIPQPTPIHNTKIDFAVFA